MIRTGNYDVVVIQGWEDAADPAKLTSWLGYAQKFADLADSTGAQPVFFCPWAMTTHNWYNAFTRYEPAFDTAGARANAPVVHVGRLWWDLRTERPLSGGIRPRVAGVFLDSLFMFSDAIHPDDSGQYVNALAFYSFMTNKSPASLGSTVSGFSFGAEFQDTMQARVWKSVTRDAQRWYSVGTREPRKPAIAPAPQDSRLRTGDATHSWTLLGAAVPAGAQAGATAVYLREPNRSTATTLRVLTE